MNLDELRDKYTYLSETYAQSSNRSQDSRAANRAMAFAQAASLVADATNHTDPRVRLTQLALDESNGELRTFYQAALRDAGWATC
jgi:hypothetical protein